MYNLFLDLIHFLDPILEIFNLLSLASPLLMDGSVGANENPSPDNSDPGVKIIKTNLGEAPKFQTAAEKEALNEKWTTSFIIEMFTNEVAHRSRHKQALKWAKSLHIRDVNYLEYLNKQNCCRQEVIQETLELVTKQQKSLTGVIKAFKSSQNIKSGRTIFNQNRGSHLRSRQALGRVLNQFRNAGYK